MKINGLIIESFVDYPNSFLADFATDIEIRRELNELDTPSLKRLSGLFALDSHALRFAKVVGIHPVTGLPWDLTPNGIDCERYDQLKERNTTIILKIKEILEQRTET